MMEDKELDLAMLHDAKEKFEKALRIDPYDLETMWSLGEVHISNILVDKSICQSAERSKEYCISALKWFKLVRDKAPKYNEDSSMPDIALRDLEYTGPYSLKESSEMECDEMQEEINDYVSSSSVNKGIHFDVEHE